MRHTIVDHTIGSRTATPLTDDAGSLTSNKSINMCTITIVIDVAVHLYLTTLWIPMMLLLEISNMSIWNDDLYSYIGRLRRLIPITLS